MINHINNQFIFIFIERVMQIPCYSIYNIIIIIVFVFFCFFCFFLFCVLCFFFSLFFPFLLLEQLRSNLNKICYSMRYSC